MGQSFISLFSDSPFGEYWHVAERYERDTQARIDGGAGNERRNNSTVDEARTALVMRSSEANLNETHKNLIAEPAEIIAFIKLNDTEAKKLISRYTGSMRSTDALEEFCGFNHLLVEKFVSIGLGYKLTSLEYNQDDFSKLTGVLLQWLFPYSELVQQHYFNDVYTLVKKEYDSQHGEELNTVQQIILFVARLLQLPKDLLVFLLKKLAALLSELKLENKRYWLPGNRNEKGRADYTPLLPVNIQGPYELVEKAFSKIDVVITLFLGEPHDEVNDPDKKGVLAFLRHYYGEVRKTLREFNRVVKELVTTLQEAIYILNAFIVGIYNGVINVVTGFIRLVAVVLDLMDAERLRLFLEGLKKLRAQIREKGFLTFMKTVLGQIISELKKRYSSDKGIYELAKNLGEDLAELIVDTIIALATGGATIIDKIKVFLKELLELIRNPKKKLSDVADYLKRKGFAIKKRIKEFKVEDLLKWDKEDWMAARILQFSDDGEAFRNAIKLRQRPEENFINIVTHGSPRSIMYEGRWVKAEEYARILRQEGWIEGVPIRLVACHSGVSSKGFAAKLAKLLNVDVDAPTNRVAVDDFGEFVHDGKGKFVTFKP